MTISWNTMASGTGPVPPPAGPVRRTFRGERGQVPLMREFLRGHLTGCACPPADLEDILVCATELATNAVLHSRSGEPGGYFTVEVSVRPRQSVYVAVRDDGGAWPRPGGAPAGDHEAESGRGLLVVAALSADMGVAGGDSGRTAWFLSQCDSG